MTIRGAISISMLVFAFCEIGNADAISDKNPTTGKGTVKAVGSLDATQRKAKSEKRLKSESVPVNASLPVIESESEAAFRTKEEVCLRAISLLVVALKGEGLEKPHIDRLVKKYDLNGSFTPEEKEFIKAGKFADKDKIKFTWKYEPAKVLLWAIGHVPRLEFPDRICDVPSLVEFLNTESRRGFISRSKLRGKSEILDEADLAYRYHWAVREYDLKGKSPPAGLESGVVSERHYALNWLIGYMGQEWDDVSTDT